MAISGAARSGLALLSLLFISGAIVMLFLLVLAGAFDKNPLNRIFFLQADTRGIPNAPDGVCHFTLYNFCGATQAGLNLDCRGNQAGYAFDPVRNFGTTTNIPREFLTRRKTFYYLSRFLYAFYIIDIFFCVCAFFSGLLTCFRLAAACTAIALFCTAFSAAVMTACFTMGQRAFLDAGRQARIGVKATAFSWTVVVCCLFAFIGFLAAAVASRRARVEKKKRRTKKGGVKKKKGEEGEKREVRDSGFDNESTRRLTGAAPAPPDLNRPVGHGGGG